MASNVTGIYLQVVEDVMKKVKTEFESDGVDESVLTELQTLWELKLMQSGSVAGSVAQEPESDFYPNLAHSQRGSAPLNASFHSAYPNHSQLPQQAQAPTYRPAGLTSTAPMPKFGQPQPFMVKPEQWDNSSLLDLNRGFRADSHGASTRPSNEVDPKRRRMETAASETGGSFQASASVAKGATSQPSSSRPAENNRAQTKPVVTKPKATPKKENDNDSTLSESDDDEDTAAGKLKRDEDPETKNLVLAMYDKVSRVKNKWKCVLKDCIIHLNGRDLLAVKANGEFDF